MGELQTQNPVVPSAAEAGPPKRGNKFGQKAKPLVNLPLEQVVIDELHLMLRITDVLTDNLLQQTMWLDKQAKSKTLAGPHTEMLVTAISACGVSFSVWEKTNADGSGSGRLDFTSLMGPDKKILLQNLPEKLEGSGALNADTENDVLLMWTTFNDIYANLGKEEFTDGEITQLEEKMKTWIKRFCELGFTAPGFGKKRVTPYIHAMLFHCPDIIRRFGNLKQFTGNGVEKTNDEARRSHMQKSNKWDACADVLLHSGRRQILSHHCREKRKYKKKDEEYWTANIKESRRKRKRIIR
ncbi:uncharacterized protein LOC135813127 [Sycon ciliatum]|uniref:uncharacterized protein LOC135813127 n=1 Tax=Sycon ciliatum TaxID=27933 RepID=UPI0031F6C666